MPVSTSIPILDHRNFNAAISPYIVTWRPHIYAATVLPNHAVRPRVTTDTLIHGRLLHDARQICASDRRGAKAAVCRSRSWEPAWSRFPSSPESDSGG